MRAPPVFGVWPIVMLTSCRSHPPGATGGQFQVSTWHGGSTSTVMVKEI
jgi:hypothetical protein